MEIADNASGWEHSRASSISVCRSNLFWGLLQSKLQYFIETNDLRSKNDL